MNALGWHWWPAPNAIASRDYGNLAALRPLRHLRDRLPARRQGERRPDALAGGDQARRAAGHRRARPRDHGRRARPGERRRSTATGRRRASPGGRPRRAGRQRRRHAAADAPVAVAAASRGPRELVRPGRPPPDAASDRRRRRVLRRGPRVVEGAGGPADPLVPVLRDRHRPRLRAGRQVAGDADPGPAPDDLAARRPAVRRGLGERAAGARPDATSGAASTGARSPRTCPDEANTVTLDPDAARRRRHPGAADHLHDRREQLAAAGLASRAAPRGAPGGRRAAPPIRCGSATTSPATCSAPRGWAPIRPPACAIRGAARTTCRTCSSSTAACS